MNYCGRVGKNQAMGRSLETTGIYIVRRLEKLPELTMVPSGLYKIGWESVISDIKVLEPSISPISSKSTVSMRIQNYITLT